MSSYNLILSFNACPLDTNREFDHHTSFLFLWTKKSQYPNKNKFILSFNCYNIATSDSHLSSFNREYFIIFNCYHDSSCSFFFKRFFLYILKVYALFWINLETASGSISEYYYYLSTASYRIFFLKSSNNQHTRKIEKSSEQFWSKANDDNNNSININNDYYLYDTIKINTTLMQQKTITTNKTTTEYAVIKQIFFSFFYYSHDYYGSSINDNFLLRRW